MKTILTTITMLLLASPVMLQAATYEYFFGTNESIYDDRGIPFSLNAPDVSLPSSFLQRLSANLPERRDVRIVNPSFVSNNAISYITVNKIDDVLVTFIHEGAHYKNSFGYFTFTGSAPTSRSEINEKIILPNVSFSHDGGSSNGLRAGNTINLGSFPIGTKIGFFLVANGWDGEHGTKDSVNDNWVHHSIAALNTETLDELKQHSILVSDNETGHIIIGFEDLRRDFDSCDHDFNDLLLIVNSASGDGIEHDGYEVLSEPNDQDNDGVLDANDEFPNDPLRAFRVYSPSKGIMGKLAYEDQWPAKGDYDMNDVVIGYNIVETRNIDNQIIDIEMELKFDARGGDIASGFAIALGDVDIDKYQSIEISTDKQIWNSILPESGQSKVVIPIVNNLHEVTKSTGCQFFNTTKDCEPVTPTTYWVKVTFNQGVDATELGSSPYNPFIYKTFSRGYEIHLPGKLPTDLANTALFGTQDDDTDVSQGKTYKTENNLPWAIDVYSDWCHPVERQAIDAGYLDFVAWATSGGTLRQDWHSVNQNQDYLFDCE